MTLGALLVLGTAVHALDSDATSEESLKQAADYVADALNAEAKGDLIARQRLLAEAAAVADFAPAQWQLGKLREGDGEWLDINASIENLANDKKLSEYERRRGAANDRFSEHVAMAAWCARQGLLDQSRAHLNRAMEFEPDNAQVRQALGFRFVGGEWISPERVVEFTERIEGTRQSVAKYGNTLSAIEVKLASDNWSVREDGAAELRAIKDADAVLAVENTLESPSPLIAREVVKWMSAMDTVEASQALMRFSLSHPVDSIRRAAAKELKRRPLHDFVPDMLQMLVSPMSMLAVPQFDRRGSLVGYRQAFGQEKADKVEVMLVDRFFPRVQLGRTSAMRTAPSAGATTMNNLVEQSLRSLAMNDAVANSAEMRRANFVVNSRNARIADVLSEVADEEFPNDPKSMWQWWDKYNETKYQEFKPERYVRTALSNRVPQYENLPRLNPRRLSGECFVAGTLVVSSRGMKPIETVVVGDRVLSRNIESGELSWKPVLRATTRPPEPTFTITVDNEQLRCTSGHLFWVSGAGWKKASELNSADVLHGAGEPRIVSSVMQTDSAPTFNLQVADNKNYFVGQAMLLTHDVTPRLNNRQVVPGLTKAN